MLAKRNRFHGHGSLRYVYKNGQAVRNHYLTVKYSKNSRRKHSRFAVVISKKVIKSAVGRNRVRRRIYEILRAQAPRFNAEYDSVWMIFSAEVRTMGHHELEKLLYDMLVESGMITSTSPRN